MYYVSDGPGGSTAYWKKYNNRFLSCIYLGKRKVNSFIGVSLTKPKEAVPIDSDSAPSVVHAAFKRAESGDYSYEPGSLIRVQVND